MYVEEKIRGGENRGALLFPGTKTSRARKMEEEANVVVVHDGEKAGDFSGYVITMPGEYDVGQFLIKGLSPRNQVGKEERSKKEEESDEDQAASSKQQGAGSKKVKREQEKGAPSAVYTVHGSEDDMVFAHFDAVAITELSEKNLEELGIVDVVALPFASASDERSYVHQVAQAIQVIEPHLVIPLVEKNKVRKAVTRELGVDSETESKLSMSRKDLPEEGFRLVFLDPQ